MGRAIAGKRDQVVLATKFGFAIDRENGRGRRRRRQPGLREARLRSARSSGWAWRHRPLLPAPGGSRASDRGDGRRDGRAGEGRQGPLPRPLGGGAGDHPAGARGASDRGAADASTRSGPATRRTSSCRRCRELGITFVAYCPLGRGFLTGADPLDRRPAPRRLAAHATRDSRGTTSRRTWSWSRSVRELAAATGHHAGAARAGVAADPGRATSCRSRARSSPGRLEENAGRRACRALARGYGGARRRHLGRLGERQPLSRLARRRRLTATLRASVYTHAFSGEGVAR